MEVSNGNTLINIPLVWNQSIDLTIRNLFSLFPVISFHAIAPLGKSEKFFLNKIFSQCKVFSTNITYSFKKNFRVEKILNNNLILLKR